LFSFQVNFFFFFFIQGKKKKIKNLYSFTCPSNYLGFAFVEYEDALDAEDAIREMNGQKFLGDTILVEFSNGGRRRPP